MQIIESAANLNSKFEFQKPRKYRFCLGNRYHNRARARRFETLRASKRLLLLISNPNRPQANQTKRKHVKSRQWAKKMFNYKQSAMLAPRPQQPKTANKNVANVENYPHTHTHTAVATLQLCRTKPIRSDTSLNQFTVSKNKHKYDTELFFAFDKNNANWSRRRSWAGGEWQVKRRPFQISFHTFSLRCDTVGWGRGKRRLCLATQTNLHCKFVSDF